MGELAKQSKMLKMAERSFRDNTSLVTNCTYFASETNEALLFLFGCSWLNGRVFERQRQTKAS